jgi:hypothetical protein
VEVTTSWQVYRWNELLVQVAPGTTPWTIILKVGEKFVYLRDMERLDGGFGGVTLAEGEEPCPCSDVHRHPRSAHDLPTAGPSTPLRLAISGNFLSHDLSLLTDERFAELERCVRVDEPIWQPWTRAIAKELLDYVREYRLRDGKP